MRFSNYSLSGVKALEEAAREMNCWIIQWARKSSKHLFFKKNRDNKQGIKSISKSTMNQHKKHTHTTTNLMYNNDDKREEREEVMLNGCKESAK